MRFGQRVAYDMRMSRKLAEAVFVNYPYQRTDMRIEIKPIVSALDTQITLMLSGTEIYQLLSALRFASLDHPGTDYILWKTHGDKDSAVANLIRALQKHIDN